MGLEQTRVQSAKLLLCQTHAFKTPVQDPSFWFHFRHDIWPPPLYLAHTHTQHVVWFRHNRSVVLGRALGGGWCGRTLWFRSQIWDGAVGEPNIRRGGGGWWWGRRSATALLTQWGEKGESGSNMPGRAATQISVLSTASYQEILLKLSVMSSNHHERRMTFNNCNWHVRQIGVNQFGHCHSLTPSTVFIFCEY